MLREVGLNLIYLASCVVCEEALGKHDKDILKTFGGPTLIIVISFCALVRLLMRFSRGVCSSRGRGGGWEVAGVNFIIVHPSLQSTAVFIKILGAPTTRIWVQVHKNLSVAP